MAEFYGKFCIKRVLLLNDVILLKDADLDTRIYKFLKNKCSEFTLRFYKCSCAKIMEFFLENSNVTLIHYKFHIHLHDFHKNYLKFFIFSLSFHYEFMKISDKKYYNLFKLQICILKLHSHTKISF